MAKTLCKGDLVRLRSDKNDFLYLQVSVTKELDEHLVKLYCEQTKKIVPVQKTMFYKASAVEVVFSVK